MLKSTRFPKQQSPSHVPMVSVVFEIYDEKGQRLVQCKQKKLFFPFHFFLFDAMLAFLKAGDRNGCLFSFSLSLSVVSCSLNGDDRPTRVVVSQALLLPPPPVNRKGRNKEASREWRRKRKKMDHRRCCRRRRQRRRRKKKSEKERKKNEKKEKKISNLDKSRGGLSLLSLSLHDDWGGK